MSAKSGSRPLYTTKWGKMYCGSAEALLTATPLTRYRGKVQLVFTSPPFPLNRKKKYGNIKGRAYVEWFASFAPLLADYLTNDGSIVIELGNAWEPRRPVMSTIPLEALLAFRERAGLNLCQEFICFNPARLPSPAEWVTVRRIRVKDAFTRVWWMARTDDPKADNKRVLTRYSNSMRQLLERGTYNSGRRPSEHHIGRTSFLADNGGAIPPSVLTPAVADMLPELLDVLPLANTKTNDPYQVHCRAIGVQPHPARMPERLVEFFIDFLTDPGDIVVDPFAGSNTTGFIAEQRRRRWLGVEANPQYAVASSARFAPIGKVVWPDGREQGAWPSFRRDPTSSKAGKAATNSPAYREIGPGLAFKGGVRPFVGL